ncbi:hypothetical protein [Bordetella avium]|uniref:hypothetical protein n=1 Tax=Bordetella avium TaxID=521 RepID=UPI000E0B2CE5|nr:hypothetical protein [Bordetella avium]AZY51066.1 hypothetical protein C0J07_00100 [Bordetella avium]RIQ15078.1 hypothetical protein D0432_02825 [Bordetella avium]RIQ41541.1 hypothetical protein D0848_03465 [Bordetella avium]RIQ45668.1 hypothetical protein D0847_00115 [Bordetella avium]RIQ46597.1 hypothetical protein D0846_00115 [Bordetella avium]
MSRSPFAGAAPLAHRPLNAIAATAGGGVPEARIKRLLKELIAPLQALHDRGRICGDVSTSSIGLDEGGRAHLMAVDTQPRQSESPGPVVVAGFAPYEFYVQSMQWPRGPWSDIYSLCAVVHSLVTGTLPAPSADRFEQDNYVPLAQRELPRYSQEFLRSIDAGLALCPQDRPQSMADFAASLAFMPAVDQAALVTIPPIELHAEEPRMLPLLHVASRRGSLALVCLSLLAMLAMAVYCWDRLANAAPPVIAASQTVPVAFVPKKSPVLLASAAQLLVPQAAAGPAPGLATEVKADNQAGIAVPLNIQPWGEVWINGVNRGVSPPLRELKLVPGKYSVMVRHGDWQPYMAALEVKAGAAISHIFR